MALGADGDFGASVPVDYVGAVLAMFPAKVLAHGRDVGARASGFLSMSVTWPGSPCLSGRVRWDAVKG